MYLHQTKLEDYIKYLYDSINISNPDELAMDEIAQKLHIEVLHSSFCNKSVRSNGRVVINLNTKLISPEDQWETFGHELFHALKDAGNQIYFPVPLRELRENKARNFALHFCIPTFMLDQLHWPESDASPFVAGKFHVNPAFVDQRLEQYRHRILQNQADEYEAIICEPAPPRYNLSEQSPETQRIMKQLKTQLTEKGEKFEIKNLL
ncbi:ImmA/IrrE family metallo-endopeptidase [Sporolactobacillus pectinivorans]|uniref:ImmA/IrrE family metallo-endopeptidase n=1 Tax=Sporolactobacillus pectinivorans TaxID=1591408 RepID=UPI000C25BFA8|nr:ImmA/IrrE family metallo-endopeptidase [Sporolactobacillus pectinivorans]